MVIGGGTGSFSVLSALKPHVADLTALVGMADDGGSTGQLRDELGVLPPGDVRQCLVALSDAPTQLRELFNYRFEDGALSGHSFGNLFLSAVEKMTHDFDEAVRVAAGVLRINGRVLPITLDNVRLALTWPDKTTVRGEGRIDAMSFSAHEGRPNLHLEPKATINPSADAAIRTADVIVIAPGDIYTSLGPLLVVGGVSQALAATKAMVMYVCNLVVKPGQTSGFSVSDHAAEIERFAGGPIIDYVLYNTAQPDPALLKKYSHEGELPVAIVRKALAGAHYQTVGRRLLATDASARQNTHDRLAAHRSFIRHEPAALARAILQISAPRK